MEKTTFLQIADNAFRKKPCSSLRPRFLTEISYIQLNNWLVVGGGFEPPKASPTDLQSVPFDHSGTPPERLNIRSPKTNRHGCIDDAVTLPLKWSQRRDSNPRPTDYKSVALPAELRWHIINIYKLLQIKLIAARQKELIHSELLATPWTKRQQAVWLNMKIRSLLRFKTVTCILPNLFYQPLYFLNTIYGC